MASMAIAAATIGLSCKTSMAALAAFDTASNYAGGGWTGSSYGTGFGPWTIVLSNANNPPYVGTYLDEGYNGNVSAPIQSGSGNSNNGGGYAWATYANSGNPANGRIDLYRPFLPNPSGYQDPSGLGTLYSQIFSIDLLSAAIGGSGQYFGFSLDTGQGASAGANPDITLKYEGGDSDGMTLTDNNGTDLLTGENQTYGDITYGDLNGGIVATVYVGNNPDGLNPYTINVTNVPETATYFSYSGSENGPMQQVDVFDNNTQNTGDEYFNDLAITPEPASLGLLAAGGIGLILRRRRKI